MTERWMSVLTFISALGAGLVSGLLFIFSVCIMKALGRLPAEQGMAAMQSINVAILNPWFLLAFFGTGVASVVLSIAAVFRWGATGIPFVLAGSLIYLFGVILVTMLCNVPLNDALAAAEPAKAGSADLWSRYIGVWTGWNHVRTVAALASLAAFIAALR